MVHVMSSQLLWPTTAKTESPRKEPTNSPRLLLNDVTAQFATRSNNDPRAIWEICKYDSLLIDLKISSHMCWPFRAGVGRAPTPSLEWSELCLDSLTWLAIPCTSDQWPGRKHKIRSSRGPVHSVFVRRVMLAIWKDYISAMLTGYQNWNWLLC